MGIGNSIFQQLLAYRESQRQYQFDFMPSRSDVRPYSVTLDAGDATVRVVAEDFGKHGLQFESLRLTRHHGQPADESASDLMRLVQSIVVDVECPYGPLKCIENDELLTCAVLRTNTTADGCFFEITVSGGIEAELRHYTISPVSRARASTAVNLGRKVFEKVADGLVEAFQNSRLEPVAQ